MIVSWWLIIDDDDEWYSFHKKTDALAPAADHSFPYLQSRVWAVATTAAVKLIYEYQQLYKETEPQPNVDNEPLLSWKLTVSIIMQHSE